ncbi:MAG: tetratricopeptide repeat protein [Candidatus Omnitrophica bacterium]|nr:tetratricopeptide repeat protein [Candidatus Omnitrophota bacterium]MBU4487830.1 tetratricopeptide repeat protein [Candidatus Omnitrophota bacterium]MCG2705426.1 tetratricopeptide repeat protein [Candidatus Omnitrophota bacterium]
MADLRKYALIIVLLSIAVYANSAFNGFVWDDEFLITKNPSIMSWNYAWIHFVLDLYHSFSNYYRPVQMITYMVDFSFWRLDPFGYHLTNILLHAILSVLFFLFLFLISKDKRIALVGAALYAVHPAHTGAVAYIAGRADILAAIFMLLSFIFFDAHFRTAKPKKVRIYYIASLIFFILSLLSKEAAVIIPVLILFYRLFFVSSEEAERSRGIIKFHYISWFIIITGVYLILRSCALNFQELGLFESRYSLYSRLLTFQEALIIYLGIVFFPVGLHMERSIDYAVSLWDKNVLLSLAGVLLIILALVRVRKVSKEACFGAIFFFVSLLPVSNIFPMNSNIAEHWLYIPLMGAMIFVSFLGMHLWDNKISMRPVIASLFMGYLIFFAYQTVDRNLDWKDDITIYSHTLRYAPDSIKMLNNIGNLYHAKRDFKKSLEFHKKAVAANPQEHRTRVNLGITYEDMGDTDEALRQYQISKDFRPDYALAYLRIGNIYLKKGNIGKAALFFKIAVKYDEFNIDARNKLGNIYFDEGFYEKAMGAYKKILEIDPYAAGAHNNLANALSRLGEADKAIEEYKKAIELDPENPEYFFNLGTEYGKEGMHGEAIGALKDAHRLNPRYVPALLNLGTAYFQKGEFVSAKKEWKKVLILDPQNTLAKDYLKKIK